ncbi:TPA: cysteine desulfuration protein SufE [Vibrio mimicus]
MTPEQLVKNFQRCMDWEQRYLYLIELGRKMPQLPPECRTDELQVRGCQSQVWIEQVRDEQGLFHFRADSDAAIVKGLLALVILVYQGRSASDILTFDMNAWLTQLELQQHLTPTRVQGLAAMISRIQITASQAQN